MQQLRKRTAGTGVGALAMGLGGERVARAGSEEPGVGAGARSSPAPEGLAGAPVMDTYVKAKSIATQQGEDPHMWVGRVRGGVGYGWDGRGVR